MGDADRGLGKAANDPAVPLKLLYIGPLSKEAGLFKLLQDLSHALEQGVKVLLVIAGSGLEEEPLRKYAARLGLADAVLFVGPAFGEYRGKLLAEADVQIMDGWCRREPRVRFAARWQPAELCESVS